MWEKHIEKLGLLRGSWEERELLRLEKIKYKQEAKEVLERPRRERDSRILTMRLDEQLTLEQIAVKESISRERVRQILRNIEKREGIIIANPHTHTPNVNTQCKTCGQAFSVYGSTFRRKGNHYCELHKGGKKYSYPSNCVTAKQKNRFRSYWRYHHDPSFREKTNGHSKRWAKKQREIGNQHFIDKQNEAAKRWQEKLKADPIRYAEHNKKMKARWREWDKLHPKKPI